MTAALELNSASPAGTTKPAAAGSSFYTAMRILPPAQREGMYRVYAFCRAVDDIADEGGTRPERMAGLDQWRHDIEHLFATGHVTARTSPLAEPVAQFGLRKADFQAVIDGMAIDATSDLCAPDWQALDDYCDKVASAVGRLSVRIFGIDEDNGIALAHHLGRALQLTNILRDIDEDAGLGRLYLPREALLEAGITNHAIAAVIAHPQLDAAARQVAARAARHFAEAKAIMARCPRPTTRSPRLMAAVYGVMLDKLCRRGWTAPRLAVRHSKHQVLWAVLRHGFF
jgi:presqualene diphosphate synthase